MVSVATAVHSGGVNGLAYDSEELEPIWRSMLAEASGASGSEWCANEAESIGGTTGRFADVQPVNPDSNIVQNNEAEQESEGNHSDVAQGHAAVTPECLGIGMAACQPDAQITDLSTSGEDLGAHCETHWQQG